MSKKSDNLEENSRWGIFFYALILFITCLIAAVTSVWVGIVGCGFFTLIISVLIVKNMRNPKLKKAPVKNAFAQFRHVGEAVSNLPGPS